MTERTIGEIDNEIEKLQHEIEKLQYEREAIIRTILVAAQSNILNRNGGCKCDPQCLDCADGERILTQLDELGNYLYIIPKRRKR